MLPKSAFQATDLATAFLTDLSLSDRCVGASDFVSLKHQIGKSAGLLSPFGSDDTCLDVD